MAGGCARVPRAARVRMAAAAAVGDARLHRRLRVHRFPAVLRAAAVVAARCLWLEPGRLLVSGDPLSAGRGVRIHGRAV
ncbi:MAG: hypothetical protein ACK56I_29570, partial [bacterium]